MADIATRPPAGMRVGGAASPGHLPIIAFGTSLSLFLVISYLLCIAGYLLFPNLPIEHSALETLLPGFKLLSWPSFFLGLVESFAFGWYIALVFGPLYNCFTTIEGRWG